MGSLKYFILIFVLFVFTALGVGGHYVYRWLQTPILQKDQVVDYYVEKGSSLSKIAVDLNKIEVLSHPKWFLYYSELLRKSNQIKPGTYRFTENDSPKLILNRLVIGETYQIKITLPEGLNIYQISQKMENYFPSVTSKEWLQYFSKSDYINMLGFGNSIHNLEGFIFPQTYFFDPHPDPDFIVKSIVTVFKKMISKDLFEKAKKIGLTPVQFVTLASIIEKETSIPEERNLVSAVYWNRLRKGMKLQADPTVIYGVWSTYNGALTKRELLTPTPYNTYTFVGLPPGPIANPGLDSFLATLNPAHSDAIFFVATGHGGHVFTNNLHDHNIAVKKYLQYIHSHQ